MSRKEVAKLEAEAAEIDKIILALQTQLKQLSEVGEQNKRLLKH